MPLGRVAGIHELDTGGRSGQLTEVDQDLDQRAGGARPAQLVVAALCLLPRDPRQPDALDRRLSALHQREQPQRGIAGARRIAIDLELQGTPEAVLGAREVIATLPELTDIVQDPGALEIGRESCRESVTLDAE